MFPIEAINLFRLISCLHHWKRKHSFVPVCELQVTLGYLFLLLSLFFTVLLCLAFYKYITFSTRSHLLICLMCGELTMQTYFGTLSNTFVERTIRQFQIKSNLSSPAIIPKKLLERNQCTEVLFGFNYWGNVDTINQLFPCQKPNIDGNNNCQSILLSLKVIWASGSLVKNKYN